MAKKGIFKSLDAAFSWHPSDVNEVITGTNMTSMQAEYSFTGKSAHAANDPHRGRSALDAVELMNVGAQFLREHIRRCETLHYAVTDSGSQSPNVVQAHAKVIYMIRSDNIPNTFKLQERLDAIAAGAAMMTGTAVKKRFIDGTSDLVTNETLEKLLYRCFERIGLPEYTKDERIFMEGLFKTYETEDLPGIGAKTDAEISELVSRATDNGKKAINDFLMPYYHTEAQQAGSTDVGDVSWQTPTAQIHCLSFASGSPGHSWQNVSAAKSTVAHKGMLTAAKVMASAAAWLYEDSGLILKARKEFESKTKRGYISPLEEGTMPKV